MQHENDFINAMLHMWDSNDERDSYLYIITTT